MSERQQRTLVPPEGLIEYGEYLSQLNDLEYEFEIEEQGRMVDHTLPEVLASYKVFLNSKALRWTVAIIYKDSKNNTMSRTTKQFTRLTYPG
jgi:hypothetical protein